MTLAELITKVNIIVGGMCWEDLIKYLKDNDKH